VRHRSRVAIYGALTICALSGVSSLAQDHQGRHTSSYYPGFAQWYPYPYPIIGYPGPVPDHAVALRLQVSPREAFVYVDGFAAGVVDDYDGVFQRLRLVPGPHEIVIYHAAHRTLRQNVYYNPGSSHTIRYTLATLAPGQAPEPQPVPRMMPPPGMPPQAGAPPAQTSRSGTLLLGVQPGDATILVDGEPQRGPEPGERLMIQVSEGPHHVRVEKNGFQPFSVEVDVRAGETASFNVTLVP
jgi:hypothetical protein